MRQEFGKAMRLAVLAGLAAAALACPAPGRADPLLDEAVQFTGTIAFLGAGAPGFVIGAVRGADSAFAGFGEIADGTGTAPTADTLFRIGSISKVFCGATLASLVADGTIGLNDRVADRIGWEVAIPEKDGRPIRVVDLATHASGLRREAASSQGPAGDPFSTNTRAAEQAGLADPLLFAPGTGVLYSNYAFDLLGATLAATAGKPYATLLGERVLAPAGMQDTRFGLAAGDEARLMRGHFFDGSEMSVVPTPETIECAGGLYTTAHDLIRWMRWHLDRAPAADSEMRRIDHAAWLWRDGMDPVSGVDDGGADMSAMGLGWVILAADGNRPLLLTKSGGLQGTFSFMALAPTRGVGVFAAMSAFNVAGFDAMVQAVDELATSLAPR